MQSTQADKLVMMANQIGKFFASQPRVKVPEAIAEHLRKFWDPRMIREIEAYLQGGGAGLDPGCARCGAVTGNAGRGRAIAVTEAFRFFA